MSPKNEKTSINPATVSEVQEYSFNQLPDNLRNFRAGSQSSDHAKPENKTPQKSTSKTQPARKLTKINKQNSAEGQQELETIMAIGVEETQHARTEKQDKTKKLVHHHNIQFQTDMTDQFGYMMQHKTDPSGFLINKFQRISVLNQRPPVQMRQFSIENQSPQRFMPQKDMPLTNGLNGRHLNPMNASINQTTTNKDKSSRVAAQLHNTEEDINKAQNQKKAPKLPNDILMSPKKVQSELQNMAVMQQINLMQQQEENKKALHQGVFSKELQQHLQKSEIDEMNIANSQIRYPPDPNKTTPIQSSSVLTKTKSKSQKQNGMNRKSELQQQIPIHDEAVQSVLISQKPQSSLNHMVPLRGTIFNGAPLTGINAPNASQIVIQPQLKVQPQRQAKVILLADDHSRAYEMTQNSIPKVSQSSGLQTEKKEKQQSVNGLLNMSKQRTYMAANDQLNGQESQHASLNTSDSRQLFQEQQNLKDQQKTITAIKGMNGRNIINQEQISRPQDQPTVPGMKSSFRVKNDSDPFKLNGKQIVQGNMFFQSRNDYDNDSQSESIQLPENNPYIYQSPDSKNRTREYEDPGVINSGKQTRGGQIEDTPERVLKSNKKVDNYSQQKEQPSVVNPNFQRFGSSSNYKNASLIPNPSCPLSVFEMQFYSGEQALNKVPPNYILHQQGIVPQIPSFVGAKGSMNGLSGAQKQAILYQNQLLQSNLSSLVMTPEEAQTKIKSGKNPQQTNIYQNGSFQKSTLNNSGSHAAFQPIFPIPQNKQVNMGGYTSLHLQSGAQQKHNKNTSEHYPVQINGRQMNVAQPHQLQGSLALKQQRGSSNQAQQELNYLAEQRMLQLHQSLKLFNYGYNSSSLQNHPQNLQNLRLLVNNGLSHFTNEAALLSQLQQLNANTLHIQLLNNEMIPLGFGDYTAQFIGAQQYINLGQMGEKQTKKQSRKPQSKIPFENAYVEDCYKFIICYGNNSGLVRKALERRSWWIEIQPVHSMFNFKWQPFSNGIKFARLGHMEQPRPGELGATGQVNAYSGITALKLQHSIQAQNDRQGCQMVNHFEEHKLLTEKYNLLNVMQKFCDQHKENPFEFMPITFYVEFTDPHKENSYSQAMQPFFQVYHTLEANKNKLHKLKDQLMKQLNLKMQLEEKEAAENQGPSSQKFKEKIQSLESVTGTSLKDAASASRITKFKTFNFEKRTSTRYSMPLCHFDSHNLWLLKPTHLNRGRGIHVFNDLDTLHKLIKQYCQGREQESLKKKDSAKDDKADKEEDYPERAQQESDNEEPKSSPTKKKSDHHAVKIRHNTFVIQKYIERPLLIYKRKFDIRVWVCLTQDHDLFFFKEGYLRTTSSEFSIDKDNVDNAFVHLTNNAVQKHSQHYGDFEDGNQLSFPRFQNIIDEFYPDRDFDVYKHMVPQMHEIIAKTFNAVRRQIDPHGYKYQFELFGYDFIFDEDFNVYLIEVNTNPCIEESSNLLKTLLPRMLEDMFKLTVDVVFPKIKKRGKEKRQAFKQTQQKSYERGVTMKRVSTGRDGRRNDEEQKEMLNGSYSECIIEPNDVDEMKLLGDDKPSPDEDMSPNKKPKLSQKPKPVESTERKKPYIEPTIKIDDERRAELYAKRIHPVNGYSDQENMWQKIANIDSASFTNTNKYQNKRSMVLCQVSEKVFKLKKNPLYPESLLPKMQEPIAEADDETPAHGDDIDNEDAIM